MLSEISDGKRSIQIVAVFGICLILHFKAEKNIYIEHKSHMKLFILYNNVKKNLKQFK